MTRRILLVTHTGREATRQQAASVTERLTLAGIEVHALPAERIEAAHAAGQPLTDGPLGLELVLALGGDGTLLRGAEFARRSGVPLLGVNLGHVGFLAEAEPDDLDHALERVLARDYAVEERMTIDVVVRFRGEVIATDWALNEAAVSKTDRSRMLECVVEVDARPVSRFGCDGVVVATPTGSTAYAFSGGGPIVWPEVSALLVVPISAHALFARPLVTSPDSRVAVEILPPAGSEIGDPDTTALLWCDGRRLVSLRPGCRVEVLRGTEPVRLVRFDTKPFADRLVAKFTLPVDGWRGVRRADGTRRGRADEISS
jgi:NAD+ kinase